MATNAKNIAELLNTDTTVKVGDIEDGSVTTAKLADGGVTTAKVADNAVTSAKALNLGRRRLNINGAMEIAQRGTSSTGLTDTKQGYQTVDRISTSLGDTNLTGELTMTQESITDLPGFSKAMKFACTTADTSTNAAEYGIIRYNFEGFDVQGIKKGFSDAQETTLSFYVKGNAAAEYTVELRDRDNDRINTQIFNVTTSWTRVELTFAADTTGKYDNDNENSLQINIWVHAGSTYTDGTFASNTWAGRTQGNRVKSSNSSIFDSTSRTLFITGLQYEINSTATDFEYLTRGEELSLCHRYYNRLGLFYQRVRLENVSSQNPDFVTTITFPPMRDAPTISTYTDANYSSSGASTTGGSSLGFINISKSSANASMNSGSSGAQNISNSAYLELDKEI